MDYTRSLDRIKILFSTKPFTDKEKQFNRKIVKKILNSKIWESDLFKHEICVLFGFRSKLLFKGSLGITLKSGTKECNTFVNDPFFEFKHLSSSSYEYLVYLTLEISASDNEICKTFTIAHELQHIIQFIFLSDDLSENHTSLWDLFRASNCNTNKLPKEKDAIRKAKIINYDINDNNDNKTVDDFVENKISELKGTDDEKYWKLVQCIDVKTDYDLETEIKKYCIKYKIC